MVGTLQFVNYKVGRTQNPNSFTEIKYCFDFFVWKYFLIHIKTWEYDPILYFLVYTFVGNSGNSEPFFSEPYSKQPKSEIHQKMPMFELLKIQVLVNSKHILTPHWKGLDVNFLRLQKSMIQITRPHPTPGLNWSPLSRNFKK